MDTSQTTQLSNLIRALAPAFICGFAIQQFMEIFVNPVLNLLPTSCQKKNVKKVIFGVLSLMIGLVISFGINLQILAALNFSTDPFWDKVITAIFISAGTAGFNSVMKFMEYSKENMQKQAKSRTTSTN
jgi:uncharacterized protein YacL